MSKPLYTLEVCIIYGPITKEFIEKNPSVCRTVEIRGDQTLAQLHEAIFSAFDREEEHMYEFQFGEEPHDLDGDRYGVHFPDQAPFIVGVSNEPTFRVSIADKPVGDVVNTTIDVLGLTAGQSFGYWFDFGDDWYHRINVVAVGEAEPEVKYPRVTERVGESPPQYVVCDEDE